MGEWSCETLRRINAFVQLSQHRPSVDGLHLDQLVCVRGWVKSGWKETDGVKLKEESDSASATRWP